jgi:hypothetical protein
MGADSKLSKPQMGGKGRAALSWNHGNPACIADYCDINSAKRGKKDQEGMGDDQ